MLLGRLTRNRTPKWGVETPRRRGRVRQGYPQALVSANWHGCLSLARPPCVRRRVVVRWLLNVGSWPVADAGNDPKETFGSRPLDRATTHKSRPDLGTVIVMNSDYC